MKHGSLFSGIGGFDLAAEWMGWQNVFHCEWMPFPRKILKYYWPKSISYEDITKTDFTIHKGGIDILTGGFPCQPYSQAGKRLGKEDERHLWPEMLRAIKEIEPTYVVGENVRGLTNWNGGVVFEEVCIDLENCGYEVQPILLPACAVGAPHRRDRIWFVAYSNSISNRRKSKQQSNSGKQGWSGKTDKREWSNREQQSFCNITSERDATDTKGNGLNECNSEYEINASERRINALNDIEQNDATYTNEKRLQCTMENGELERRKRFAFSYKHDTWHSFPTQSAICGRDDGIPGGLDRITFSKWRQESIKGYGNAIVPQVAYQIFKIINHLN